MATPRKKKKKCARCTEFEEQLNVLDHKMSVIERAAEGYGTDLSEEDFRYTSAYANVVQLLKKYRSEKKEVYDLQATCSIRECHAVSQFLHQQGITPHLGDYKGALEDWARKIEAKSVTVHYLRNGYTACGRDVDTLKPNDYFLKEDKWDDVYAIARGHNMRAEHCQACSDRVQKLRALEGFRETRKHHWADFSPREK